MYLHRVFRLVPVHHLRSFYGVTNEGVIFHASASLRMRCIHRSAGMHAAGIGIYRNNSASVHAQEYASEYSRVRTLSLSNRKSPRNNGRI